MLDPALGSEKLLYICSAPAPVEGSPSWALCGAWRHRGELVQPPCQRPDEPSLVRGGLLRAQHVRTPEARAYPEPRSWCLNPAPINGTRAAWRNGRCQGPTSSWWRQKPSGDASGQGL